MTQKLPLLLLLLCQFAVHAQVPIFSPSSIISTFGSVNSPSAEQVNNVIDGNVNTKYLDIFDFDGIGFTVNLNGIAKTATSMKFTTANDQPARDPKFFEILGSNDGNNFTLVASGSIVCNGTRFNTTTYEFPNTNSYSYYRLIFTNQCNTSETIFQIAEVQLFQTDLGINLFEENNIFTLYPNPSKGFLTVQSDTIIPIDTITVSDALGKQVKQIQINGSTSQINLQGIVSGIYFVKINYGNKSQTKKIVIE